uniref:Plastocyanin-like domain-containing protein n=1 Tax=Trypanosoma congolense (strain IL3000) TaxID=1068625 RepID=G0UK43_TRYCI|nr:conserved hypothetical protein [Trypanosoma congolense IL3000]
MKGASYIQQSVALLSVLLLLCGRPGTGKKLIPLTSVHPSGNDTILNLNIRPVRVSVPLRDLGEAETFTYMARLYVYNGVPLLPGPTVHVKPGGRLILNLFNDLGSQYYSADETMMYSFHDVNTTNIHFHGLHANPAIDDVFKVVNPRQSIRYRLPIPETHLPGLHWYHTHSHGSSYALLMGGLFGALVVDCGRNDVLAGKPHVTLIIHLYRMGASTLCDGDTMQLVDSAIGSNMSSRPRILDGKGRELRGVSDLFLVNGQHRPTVTVREGETTIFRMLFAAGSCYLNVSLPENLSISHYCR